MPGSCDHLVDLGAGQLASFSGLGPLGNLDLQLIGVGQVPGRDAKPPRCHLLDRRPFRVTVLQRLESPIVLSALASIALASYPIHRDRQRLVRFDRDGPVAHRTSAEPLDDFAGRLDLLQGNALPLGKRQQPSQVALASRLLVDQFREAIVGRPVTGPCGLLNLGDRVRVPGVLFARSPPMVQAGVGQRSRRIRCPITRGIPQFVTTQRFISHHIESHALDAAGRADETTRDYLIVKPHRFEDLRPLVTLQRRDPHFAHHLEHALGHALAVDRDDLLLGPRFVQQAVAAGLRNRFEGQVRVDCIGPIAHQQTVMVHFSGLAALQHKADPGSQFISDQVVMHGTAGQQRADRDAIATGAAITEDDETVTGINGCLDFTTDPLQRGLQSLGPLAAIKRDVDCPRGPTVIIQ